MANPNAAPGADLPDLPALSDELAVTAAWPVRCGAVPALAERFTARPESAPDLGLTLGRFTEIALAARARRDIEPSQSNLNRSTGKTQLAAHYAESQWQARALDLLIWADGSSRARILTGYAHAVRALTGRHPTAAANAVGASLIRWLARTDRRWLIVLDDVQDAEDLSGLWPRGPAGRLILTTPSAAAMPERPDLQVLELGPFTPREAMNYLVGRLSSDPDQRRGAIDLIQDLNYQPLALAQATSVILSSRQTCADYRDRFYSRSADLTVSASRPPPTGVTWTLSFELADRLEPGGQAHSCLAIAALLDGHGIPASVFLTSSAADYIVGDSPAAWASRGDTARTTLAALQQAGLLSAEWQADPPLIRMNPALQRAVQLAMTPDLHEQSARAAAAALLEAWRNSGADNRDGYWLRSSTISLWRAVRGLLWSGGCHPVLLRAGQSFDAALLTDQAADYWTDLATTAEQLLGPAHPDFTVIAERLASASVTAGRGDDAAAWFRGIVDVWSQSLGPDHPRILAARVTLARVLIAAGLHGEAVRALTEVLHDAERVHGPRHPDFATIRDQVAAGYRQAGEVEEATRLYRLILTDRERTIGPRHAQTTATRQLLADSYLAAGRARDAFAQYKRVIASQRRDLGRDHPDTLRATAALGGAYFQLGRMAQAVQVYEGVHQDQVRVLGPDHRDTLEVALSLGRVYYSVGRLTDARVLLSDTEQRSEQALGPGDLLTLSARQSLAAI